MNKAYKTISAKMTSNPSTYHLQKTRESIPWKAPMHHREAKTTQFCKDNGQRHKEARSSSSSKDLIKLETR